MVSQIISGLCVQKLHHILVFEGVLWEKNDFLATDSISQEKLKVKIYLLGLS